MNQLLVLLSLLFDSSDTGVKVRSDPQLDQISVKFLCTWTSRNSEAIHSVQSQRSGNVLKTIANEPVFRSLLILASYEDRNIA